MVFPAELNSWNGITKKIHSHNLACGLQKYLSCNNRYANDNKSGLVYLNSESQLGNLLLKIYRFTSPTDCSSIGGTRNSARLKQITISSIFCFSTAEFVLNQRVLVDHQDLQEWNLRMHWHVRSCVPTHFSRALMLGAAIRCMVDSRSAMDRLSSSFIFVTSSLPSSCQ